MDLIVSPAQVFNLSVPLFITYQSLYFHGIIKSADHVGAAQHRKSNRYKPREKCDLCDYVLRLLCVVMNFTHISWDGEKNKKHLAVLKEETPC